MRRVVSARRGLRLQASRAVAARSAPLGADRDTPRGAVPPCGSVLAAGMLMYLPPSAVARGASVLPDR